jgi:hypothetical protein
MGSGTRRGPISFDAIADALSDVDRRRLLVALVRLDPGTDAVTLEELRAEFDSLEHSLEMEHIHLPKLDEYGFVSWDRELGEIAMGPEFEAIGTVVEALDSRPEDLPPDWV